MFTYYHLPFGYQGWSSRPTLVFLSLQLGLHPLVTTTSRLKILQWAHGSLAAHVHGRAHSSGLPKCAWMVAYA